MSVGIKVRSMLLNDMPQIDAQPRIPGAWTPRRREVVVGRYLDPEVAIDEPTPNSTNVSAALGTRPDFF